MTSHYDVTLFPGISVDADAFDQVRSTPPGQAAPSPALMQNEPEKYDDSKVRFLNRKCFDF